MLSKENLLKAMEEAGYTYDRLSLETGIARACIVSYARNMSDIPSSRLEKIADVLKCSTDFLCGRTDILCRDPGERRSFRDDIMRKIIDEELEGQSIRKLSLKKRESVIAGDSGGPIAVWPYNILGVIFANGNMKKSDYAENLNKTVHIPISPDQERGLEEALKMLSDKEYTVIEKRYVEGLRLEDTAAFIKTDGTASSRAYADTIEKKAIYKLRHPAARNLILYGYRGCGIRQRERRLKEEEKRLAIKEEHMAVMHARADRELDKLDSPHTAVETACNAIGMSPEETKRLYARSIDILKLTVRPFNCLRRAGINDMGQLIEYISIHGYSWPDEIRNLGKNSTKEIVEKFTALLGKDYYMYLLRKIA